MAMEALTKQFRELINDCTQSPVDELLINPDWGKISFEGCRPELERTYSMLNQFKLLPLDLLPDGQRSKSSVRCRPSSRPSSKFGPSQLSQATRQERAMNWLTSSRAKPTSSLRRRICTSRTSPIRRAMCSGTSTS